MTYFISNRITKIAFNICVLVLPIWLISVLVPSIKGQLSFIDANIFPSYFSVLIIVVFKVLLLIGIVYLGLGLLFLFIYLTKNFLYLIGVFSRSSDLGFGNFLVTSIYLFTLTFGIAKYADIFFSKDFFNLFLREWHLYSLNLIMASFGFIIFIAMKVIPQERY